MGKNKRKAKLLQGGESLHGTPQHKKKRHNKSIIKTDEVLQNNYISNSPKNSPKKQKSQQPSASNSSSFNFVKSPKVNPEKMDKVIKAKNILEPKRKRDASNGTPKKNKTKKMDKSRIKQEITLIESDEDDEPEQYQILPVESDVVVQQTEVSEPDIDLTELPRADLDHLLKAIEREIPEGDTLASKTRARKINWEKIAFADYSAEKCSRLWEAIQKRLRPHRTLGELVSDAVVWLEKPWQSFGKAVSTKNHPDYPKRPKSSFMLFLSEVKDEIMKENKGVKITELARIAGVKFKNLPEHTKNTYRKRAADSMKKFDEEVKLFFEKHPELKPHENKLTGPNKPQTPFALFLADHMKKEEDIPDKHAYRMASKEVWKNMTSKKKLKWIKLALAEQKQYLDELNVYNFEHPNNTIKPTKAVLNKDELLIFNEAEGKPKKPPASSYVLFTQCMMKTDEFHDMLASDRMKAIAAKWQTIGKAEKQDYVEQVQQIRQKYKEDYQAYLEKLPEEERLKLEVENQPKKKTGGSSTKRNEVAKSELLNLAKPKNWEAMAEDHKDAYKSALDRIRDYFDTKFDETIKVESKASDSDGGAKSSDSEHSEAGSVKNENEQSDSDSDESD